MVKSDIDVLRKELNKSIIKDEDYSKIYNLSIKLDELIAEYYRQNIQKI